MQDLLSAKHFQQQMQHEKFLCHLKDFFQLVTFIMLKSKLFHMPKLNQQFKINLLILSE